MTLAPDRSASEAPHLPPVEHHPASANLVRLLTLLRLDQRLRWQRGERLGVDDYLDRYPVLRADTDAAIDMICAELVLRLECGQAVSQDEYRARFPLHSDRLKEVFDWLGAPLACVPSQGSCDRASEAKTVPPASPASAASMPGVLATVDWSAPPPTGNGPLAETQPPKEIGQEERASSLVSVAVPGYEVLDRLGKGGMGVVYKARHLSLKRIVALKMILHVEHAGEEERWRFKAEAEAVASLQHPHVVQIHEVGEHMGVPYFSLEYCPGGSLAGQMDGTPWEARKAAALVEVLARAMHAAHQAGIVHRDLKPGNVLLTADGEPKVTDFGLAKKIDEAGQTRTGAIMGTPSYMAPEQAEGRKDIGPAADVYALGAILYELLTGRPPFKAATPFDTVLQVLADEAVPVRRLQPKVPKDLETVCHKCLQKDSRRRYASAQDLAEDLRRWQASEPIRARPVGSVERGWKWVRRNPAVAGMWAAVLTAVLLGGFGAWWLGQQRGEQRRGVETALA